MCTACMVSIHYQYADIRHVRFSASSRRRETSEYCSKSLLLRRVIRKGMNAYMRKQPLSKHGKIPRVLQFDLADNRLLII